MIFLFDNFPTFGSCLAATLWALTWWEREKKKMKCQIKIWKWWNKKRTAFEIKGTKKIHVNLMGSTRQIRNQLHVSLFVCRPILYLIFTLCLSKSPKHTEKSTLNIGQKSKWIKKNEKTENERRTLDTLKSAAIIRFFCFVQLFIFRCITTMEWKKTNCGHSRTNKSNKKRHELENQKNNFGLWYTHKCVFNERKMQNTFILMNYMDEKKKEIEKVEWKSVFMECWKSGTFSHFIVSHAQLNPINSIWNVHKRHFGMMEFIKYFLFFFGIVSALRTMHTHTLFENFSSRIFLSCDFICFLFSLIVLVSIKYECRWQRHWESVVAKWRFG